MSPGKFLEEMGGFRVRTHLAESLGASPQDPALKAERRRMRQPAEKGVGWGEGENRIGRDTEAG